MIDFCHLHNHTQFSLLDGASDIDKMMKKAVGDGQKAVAITDHGNMFGAFKFVKAAKKAGIKAIIGCEFYMVEDRHKKSFEKSKGEKDKRYHQLLLAKNRKGYENLCKLSSIGFLEGFYSKYPRIDKEILVQYSEGLIGTSCCIGAEIPQAIFHNDIEKAERLTKWWLDLLGEDFYIEIQRQKGMENIDKSGISQEFVNMHLLRIAQKYNIKVIATNDSHYLDQDDSLPHDVLLCVNTGARFADSERFKFSSNDYYFKTKAEMGNVFSDLPFALENTIEIADKVEELSLARDILLPEFPVPPNYGSQEEYLRHLTFERAKKRYPNMTDVVNDRLNFELDVIIKSGYSGYFLIVQDFTTTARQMGVAVGPGRGSAAGSAVAYCLGITNIDPIAYDLLFERFLNPERVSMPDVDIDFDDEGRDKVINYVIDKYGKNKVAQIVTYGTMAARSSLRDVGRVLDIPLSEVDRVAKDFPESAAASLEGILEGDSLSQEMKDQFELSDVDRANRFRELAKEDSQLGEMIRTARKLEGSVRNTGIHACGVIITPEDMTNIIPVMTAKDSDLMVSQFDNSVAEESGLLKMDFLGLRTLSIIKDAVANIKATKGIEMDIDEVDLTDELTYQLFHKGDTVGIFQYESPGMQKHLKELKPTCFDDLIAMNALYRPGPIQYIPSFIARKNGREDISYDVPEQEEYLKSTYGITVYQEQVMLLSQKLAGFSKGQADVLRKAMGKKNRKLIDELWPEFLAGCLKNNLAEDKVKKIWTDWEFFASYAFNKSHSTCYAFIAFQTAFLKAHYPSEFLAAVLSHNKNDISKVKFFLEEGKRMKIDILGPDVNESQLNFSVNKKGQIRFGMSALKGVGEGPVEAILEERETNGLFVDACDVAQRLNLRAFNKKCMDSLAAGGAFDCFTETHRAQYFYPSLNYETYIEHLLKFGQSFQEQKSSTQLSLFGAMDLETFTKPTPPKCEEWSLFQRLEQEKEVTGIYLSGHPLDDYLVEMNNIVNYPLNMAGDILDRDLKLAGIVTEVMHGINQKGNGYCRFTVHDYDGSMELGLYNEDYARMKGLIEKGNILYIECVNKSPYQEGGRTFMKVKNIEFLESAGKRLIKKITIRVNLDKLTETVLDFMQNIVNTDDGLQQITFQIADEEDYLELENKLHKVTISKQLIDSLEEFGLLYRLN